MRRILIASVALSAAIGLGKFSFGADDDKKGEQTVHGVLIDNACGKKQMAKDDPEKSAADHPKSCSIKCGKEGGYAVITGKKMFKFDDDGNKLAKEYFEGHDGTHVIVKGVEKGDQIVVVSIAADKDKDKDKDK